MEEVHLLNSFSLPQRILTTGRRPFVIAQRVNEHASRTECRCMCTPCVYCAYASRSTWGLHVGQINVLHKYHQYSGTASRFHPLTILGSLPSLLYLLSSLAFYSLQTDSILNNRRTYTQIFSISISFVVACMPVLEVIHYSQTLHAIRFRSPLRLVEIVPRASQRIRISSRRPRKSTYVFPLSNVHIIF